MTRQMTVVTLATVILGTSLQTAVADESDAARADQQHGKANAAEEQADTNTYTWDELVELIPDLREMTLEPGTDAGTDTQSALDQRLCRMETQLGSRIRRRRCYSLREVIEEYIQSRLRQDEILSNRMTYGYVE